MKLRSLDADVSGRLVRGRYSKIQNNCVYLTFPSGAQLELYQELQPLQRKDALTIGQAVLNVAGAALNSLTSAEKKRWTTLRVHYILTGDGVNTNMASAKRVFSYLRDHPHRNGCHVDVRLVVVRCASHVANLVVQVAVVGEILARPLEDSELCGALSRLYKYLMPTYVEEYNASLQTFVRSKLQILEGLPGDADIPFADRREVSQGLRKLYGSDVIPEDLLAVFNRGLGVWVHVSPLPGQQHSCMQEAFRSLSI